MLKEATEPATTAVFTTLDPFAAATTPAMPAAAEAMIVSVKVSVHFDLDPIPICLNFRYIEIGGARNPFFDTV